MEKRYLQNNRLVKSSDYQTAFKVCLKKAQKMLRSDKDEICKVFTMHHFFLTYDCFPPKFTPVFRAL